MNATTTVNQEENRTKAVLMSLLFHAALLAMLYFYRFHSSAPITEAPAILLDWGGGGDNAAAGLPDEGQGDNPAPQGQQMEDPTSTEPAEEPASDAAAAAPPPSKTPPAADRSKVEVPKNTPTSNDPEAAAVRRAQEEAKRKQLQEQERVRKEQETARLAEAERQRQAAAEAERQRQAQADRDKKKGQFGSTFGRPGDTGPGPASFWGLALTVADIDAAAALLGEHLGPVTDAVQPGRRIATLRHEAVGIPVPVAFLSPAPRRPSPP